MAQKNKEKKSYLSPARLLRESQPFSQYAQTQINESNPETRKHIFREYKKQQTQKSKERAIQLLNPEYAAYIKQQQIPRRAELQAKIKVGERNIKRFERQRRYAGSGTGRFGSFLARGIRRIQQPTASLYEGSIPITSTNVQQAYPTMPRTVRGSSGGKVGRPRQTYDKRYAQFGGVYGYRKMLAAKLRERRLQLQAQANISPQQQMVINRYQSQQAYNQQNPEGRIIPSTMGHVDMNQIWDDINNAANAVA